MRKLFILGGLRNSMNRRAQGALEFLTTYGWAFLVVLVLVGALSHFGVLSMPGVKKCTSEQGFGCESVVVTDKTQNFKFKNTLGTDVAITGATATVKSTGENISCETTDSVVSDGESFAIKCAGELSAGKNEQLDVSFKYYSPTGSDAYAKVVSAGVSQKVENFEEYETTTKQSYNEFLQTIENYDGHIYCPQGFTYVPGSTYLEVPDFCVMTYEARRNGSLPISVSSGLPWVSISYYDAYYACDAAGYDLITNLEWLTIARNMESVLYNWDSGLKGVGKIYRGNSDSGQLKDSTSDLTGINRRTLYLSNGGEIWDFAGNAKEWTDLPEAGSPYVSLDGNSCSGTGWFSFHENDGMSACQWRSSYTRSSSLDKKYELGPFVAYNANQGVGRIYSVATTGKALLRGGHFINGLDGGIYSADFGGSPHWSANSWGFRCTTEPY